MINTTLHAYQFVGGRLKTRLGWVLAIATCEWLLGWAPGLSPHRFSITLTPAAQAQTSSQISNYAAAVLDMEPLRVKAYREVQRIMDGKVPNDVCRQGGLPGNVRSICDQFFDQSAEIIKRNNLSIGEFNQITRQVHQDTDLKKRVQQELRRHQKQR